MVVIYKINSQLPADLKPGQLILEINTNVNVYCCRSVLYVGK